MLKDTSRLLLNTWIGFVLGRASRLFLKSAGLSGVLKGYTPVLHSTGLSLFGKDLMLEVRTAAYTRCL